MASIASRMNPVRDPTHSPPRSLVDDQHHHLHRSNGPSHVRVTPSVLLVSPDYRLRFLGFRDSSRYILVTKYIMILNLEFQFVESLSWLYISFLRLFWLFSRTFFPLLYCIISCISQIEYGKTLM
jgi:hypothetical protein